jgi:hypothetical protein
VGSGCSGEKRKEIAAAKIDSLLLEYPNHHIVEGELLNFSTMNQEPVRRV